MVDQIRQVIDALNGVTEQLMRKITLDIVANLQETTPVDTGWARANWIPHIGAELDEDLRGISPDDARISGDQGRQQSGIAQVATNYTLTDGAIFITNNVPYIERLNDGSSTQAPAGFVQAAIDKAVTEDIRGFKG